MKKDIKTRAKNNRLDPDFVAGIDLASSRNNIHLEEELQEQNSRDNFW